MNAMRLSRVLEELLPFAYYVARKNRLRRRSDSDRILNSEAFSEYSMLPTETLKNRLNEERQRAHSMDEKTFKLTLSFSVGLTVLGLTTTSIARIIPYATIQVILIALMTLGLIFVLLAGFVALGALRTFPSYGYGTAFLLKLERTEDKQVVLATALARQETINNIRHLRNETAYQMLRNGLLFLFLGLLLSLAALTYQYVNSATATNRDTDLARCQASNAFVSSADEECRGQHLEDCREDRLTKPMQL